MSDRWVDHEPTAEEMLAQVKISKTWKGHFVRRLHTARTPGNDIHQKTYDCLLKISQALDPQTESAGLNLLRFVTYGYLPLVKVHSVTILITGVISNYNYTTQNSVDFAEKLLCIFLIFEVTSRMPFDWKDFCGCYNPTFQSCSGTNVREQAFQIYRP